MILTAVPDGRLFGVDSQTIIQIAATIINVCVLAFILSKVLYNPVSEFLRKRTNRIVEQLKEAKDDAEKASALKLEYEQKMQNVERECEELLEEARKSAAESTRLIIAEAKEEATAIKDRASANVEQEWARAQDEMRIAIIEVASAMTEKFVARVMDEETQNNLFATTMAELEGKTWRD